MRFARKRARKRAGALSPFPLYSPAVTNAPVLAVCLDAGNTLIHCDPPPHVIYADHLSRHGRPVAPAEVGIAFRAAWAEMQLETEPGADRYGSLAGGERAWWGAFVRRVLRRLDHDAAWEPLLDELYAAFSRAEVWRAFPDTRPALSALSERGVALAVISNWDRRLPRILDDLELTGYFATITVSSLEGVEKPDPEIFRRTLDRLGVAPHRALHVGDSPREDCEGAAEAGLQAVLIDRHGLFANEPRHRIASLAELLDLVL